jgi:hypothetical protein
LTTLASQPGRRSISRDELVQLGRAGRPWDFVPLGVQVVASAPGDAGVRFLLAANFARLGLVTLAREQMSAIPAEVRQDPDVQALSGAILAMPNDVMPAAERVARGKAAAEALRLRGVDVFSDLEFWVDQASGYECFRTLDGNVVRRRSKGLELLGDHKGLAAKFVRGTTGSGTKTFDKPFVIEGVDPPWLLRALFDATPQRADGFQPRLRVVQASAMELLDGLSLADMRDVLESERCELFVGPRACEELRERLRSGMSYAVTGQTLALPSLRVRAMPPLGDVMAEVDAAQRDLAAGLHQRANAKYAGRDAAWWAGRYAAALAGGAPLRVLIPTTRFSTFVKHSSADLAGALRRLGHDARVLIEPDDHSLLSAVAYLREVVDFEPDLVLSINYTRANLNGREGSVSPFPANVPFVCWIQDAMSHLFDPAVGAKQSALDFVIGHTFPELFERFGYPRERAMRCAVGADVAKFSGGAPAAHLRKRYECDIAFVSNHSEAPETLLARLTPILAGPLAAAAGELASVVREEARTPPGPRPWVPMRDRVGEILTRTLGAAPDPRLTDTVVHQFADPYADRLMRHDTLRWAANAAARRGWRMKLFGRGWEKNPEFARFAAGELAHGEDLRAAYHAAAVQLQVTCHTLVHQRLFECVLSGGFQLCRMHQPEFMKLHQRLLYDATEKTLLASASAWPLIRHRLARFEDNPQLERLMRVWRTLGMEAQVAMCVDGKALGLMLHNAFFNEGYRPEAPNAADRDNAFALLGDRPEFFFWNEATLEARVGWALERGAERRELVEGAANRVRAAQTYETVAAEVLKFVATGLGGAGDVR